MVNTYNELAVNGDPPFNLVYVEPLRVIDIVAEISSDSVNLNADAPSIADIMLESKNITFEFLFPLTFPFGLRAPTVFTPSNYSSVHSTVIVTAVVFPGAV